MRERLRPGSTARPWWAEELSADEAAAFWPLGLQVAPDYRWFLNLAGRRPMPLVRLVPTCPASASAREIAEGMYRLSVYASDVYFVTSRR